MSSRLVRSSSSSVAITANGGKKMKRLYRSRDDRMIAGVLGGLGEYLGIDATIVRLLWVVGTFLTGIVPGVVLYVLFWAIIPPEPAAGGQA